MSKDATFLVKVNCTMDKDGENFKLSTIKDIKIEGMALADADADKIFLEKIKAIEDIIVDDNIRSDMKLTLGGKKTAKRRRRRKRGKKSRQRRK